MIRMKEQFKRTGALFLVLVMGAFVFPGCSHKLKADTTSVNPEGVTEETTADSVYPIDTDVTLTYWMELNSNVAANYNNMAETPFGRNLTKETGIGIEYIHPASGQVPEAFNLSLHIL